jgi:hypothetical protein
MKRSSVSTQVWIVTAMFMILVPHLARGDGGIVQLHETKGPFSVTVFVSPEGARGGLADVTVLVQWRKNGDVVLDADVILALDPPAGVVMNQSNPLCGVTSAAAVIPSPELTQHQVKAQATRGQAFNKLLYAAPLALSTSGDWRLHMLVSHGSDSAGFDCLLPVTITSAKLPGLWPYLVFPPIVITAFALNQGLRRHSLEKELESQSRSS